MKEYSSFFSSDQHPHVVPGQPGFFIFSFCPGSIGGNTFMGQVKTTGETFYLTELNGQQIIYLLHILCKPTVTTISYHLPLGLVVKPTHAKWNHSMEHWRTHKTTMMHHVVFLTNGALSPDKTNASTHKKKIIFFKEKYHIQFCSI